jgi:hypothetical protein
MYTTRWYPTFYCDTLPRPFRVSYEKAFPVSTTNKASGDIYTPFEAFVFGEVILMNGDSFKSKLIVIFSADAKGKEVQDATGICDV